MAGARLRSRARRAWDRAGWVGTPILDAEEGNAAIAGLVAAGTPAAAGRAGSIELSAVRHWLRAARPDGRCEDWDGLARPLHVNAGVFPPDPETLSRFASTYLDAISALDLYAEWSRPGEARLVRAHAPQARVTRLAALEGYYHERPWTAALTGKRVVVASPFVATIERQYARRELLWPERPDVLPAFELRTLRTPFSAGIASSPYVSWPDGLDALRAELERAPFDVALTGCGAWSLPLAAHAKSLGGCGIYLGGATQILFGIMGARWDDHPVISGYYNDAWVRPGDDERPDGLASVEGGCYW
jgi:hypothetical protein